MPGFLIPLLFRDAAAPNPTPVASFPQAGLTPESIGGQRVYVRQTWAAAWSQVADAWCVEAVWSAAPTLPTATIVFQYGEIAQPESQSFVTFDKLLGMGRVYVLVEFDCESDGMGGYNVRRWVGVLDVATDDQDGATFAAGEPTGSGEQTFTAYGLEKLLADKYVDGSIIGSGDRISRPVTFNARGRANMTTAPVGSAYAFSDDPESVWFWDTYNICLYLLEHQTPRDAAGVESVPFKFDALQIPNPLPTFDAPVVYQEGRTVYDLLCELIPAERLYSWFIDADILDNANVRVFTLTPDTIQAPLGSEQSDVPANADVIDVIIERDQSAASTVKISTAEQFDRVTFRGERRRIVFSVSYADGTLSDNWDSDLTLEYNAGGSDAGNYPSDTLGKRKRDTEARNRERLRNVFASFAIVNGWDGRAGNGEGDTGETSAAIVDERDPAGDPLPYYPLDLTIEPTLPLFEGVDYSGDAIENETVDESEAKAERPLLVVWKLPPESADDYSEGRRWQNIETIGRSAELPDINDQGLEWSANVSAIPDDRALRIDVTGKPQHVIASFDFVPLDHDLPMPAPCTYREMIATISIRDDYYCEASWPAVATAPAGRDLVRELLLDAGAGYRLDYVTPQTVVDVDGYGELVRSNGGFVHDDRGRLLGFARVAHARYSQDRRTLSFETDQLTTLLAIGQLIDRLNTKAAAGDADAFYRIRSVITEIRISSPVSDGNGAVELPRMRVTTDYGQLSPLSFPLDPPAPANQPTTAATIFRVPLSDYVPR